MSTVAFYKITCFITGACYVGSTRSSIEIRLQKHEHDYREYLKNKIRFHPCFTILKNDNYRIELIDSVICLDKKMINIINELYVLNEEAINTRQHGQDRKEYQHQYYTDNKEQIQQKRNELIVCPCGGRYTRTHRARHMKTKKHIAYENEKQN